MGFLSKAKKKMKKAAKKTGKFVKKHKKTIAAVAIGTTALGVGAYAISKYGKSKQAKGERKGYRRGFSEGKRSERLKLKDAYYKRAARKRSYGNLKGAKRDLNIARRI